MIWGSSFWWSVDWSFSGHRYVLPSHTWRAWSQNLCCELSLVPSHSCYCWFCWWKGLFSCLRFKFFIVCLNWCFHWVALSRIAEKSLEIWIEVLWYLLYQLFFQRDERYPWSWPFGLIILWYVWFIPPPYRYLNSNSLYFESSLLFLYQ